MGYQKKRLIALVLGILLSGACGPVSQNPELMAKRANESAAAAGSSTFAAGINKNIAAAALLSSNASSEYRIGPEDLLEITLYNVPEARGSETHVTPRTLTVRVTHQGQISLPVVGEVAVNGLTISGLEKRIREAYDKYIYNPQVGVLIKEFRQRASVIGAVQKPGVFELTGPKSVIELLAMAGGVSEKAGGGIDGDIK